MTTFLPTALETPVCPPHHWAIRNDMMGICLKCGLVKDFSISKPKLQSSVTGGVKPLSASVQKKEETNGKHASPTQSLWADTDTRQLQFRYDLPRSDGTRRTLPL